MILPMRLSNYILYALINPDDVNVIALVYFGTPEAYDKWSESLLEIILSIIPAE